MESKRITANGCQWHVLSHGDGPPLLFLHGFTGSSESWVPIMEELGALFTCIAVDILGHGQTDAPLDGSRYEMTHVVTDILSVMDALGHRTFGCVGYSMGGRVALALAFAAPERIKALVLESASPGLQTAQERTFRVERDNALADKIEQIGVPSFVDEWQALPLFTSQSRLPQPVLTRQRMIRCRQTAQGLAGSLRGMGTGAQPSYWDELKSMPVRTLLLTGELDAKFYAIASDMQQEMQNARHEVIESAGHTVHLERPADYIRTVKAFLLMTFP
jgi:2-succinyl-6-hydroxy-2,4-cyclohexadiene-1-carboxylate synthase